MDSSQQLVSNYVRFFLEDDGGSIRFAAKRDADGRLCWEILASCQMARSIRSNCLRQVVQKYSNHLTPLLPTGNLSTQRRVKLQFPIILRQQVIFGLSLLLIRSFPGRPRGEHGL